MQGDCRKVGYYCKRVENLNDVLGTRFEDLATSTVWCKQWEKEFLSELSLHIRTIFICECMPTMMVNVESMTRYFTDQLNNKTVFDALFHIIANSKLKLKETCVLKRRSI